MTKALSNKMLRAALGALLVLSAVQPAMAKGPSGALKPDPAAKMMAAESATGTPASGKAQACARIVAFSADLQQRLETRQSAIDGRRDERKAKLDELRAKHESRRLETKNRWQENWNGLVERLQSDAVNDGQKAAIADYRTAMESAFMARSVAVETADKAFRDGLAKLDADKTKATSAAIAAYRTAVKTAIDKAKSDCASGKDPQTVRDALKSSLDAAKGKLQDDRKSLDAVGQKVKDLVDARQAAVEKALADFKVAATKARDTLKTALAAAAPPDMNASSTKETGDDKNGGNDDAGDDHGSATNTDQE